MSYLGFGFGFGFGGGGGGRLIPSFLMPLVGGGAGFLAMINPSKSEDVEHNRLLVIKEALRHTELRLEDLEKNATSAERRIGVFVSICTVLASVTFLYSVRLPSFTCALISGFLIVVAATIAIWSALPKRFHVRGHFWRDWKDHVEHEDTLSDVLVSQAEENDQRIIVNENELERMAKRFRTCFVLLTYALLFNLFGQLGAAI